MPKHHNVACLLFVVLGLAGCEFTKEGDPSDGPCGKRCEGELPYCNQDLKECVSCLENAHCTEAGKSLCQTSTGKCGACTSSADCDEPDKARCDSETLVCVACQEHSDCKGIAGTEACGPDGMCVECTADNEAGCDGKICEPGATTCSDTVEQDSAENCEACVADSECKEDHKCVPMLYQDVAHGNYCLRLAEGNCTEPYRFPMDGRTSVNGAAPEDFCGINEDLTTCEALLAFDKDCDENGKCFIDDVEVPVPGALCRTVSGTADRCTYYCSNATQCDLDINCSGTGDPIANNRYCGQ